MDSFMLTRRGFLRNVLAMGGLGSAGGICVYQVASMLSSPGQTKRRALKIASTKDMGAIGKPASVLVRDGGATLLLGGRLLWMFGDTLVSNDPQIRSNTAALADPEQPLVTHDVLDAHGRPYQFVPFTAEEQAYNDATGKPDDRIAIWPASAIEYHGQALVFSYKLHVKPGTLNYESLGVALALVQPGQTQAKRLPGLLFTYPEPDFVCAQVYQGYVYVYGGNHSSDNANVVARVPLDQATERTAYTFWNGKTWGSDVRQALPVLSQLPGSVTVSYNDYLGQFLVTNNQPLSPDLFLRTGPNFTGPWDSPVAAFRQLPPSSDGFNYAGIEHPELAKHGGRTIYVSYFNTTGFLAGDLRLVEVNFA
jgi:hypothetical protein